MYVVERLSKIYRQRLGSSKQEKIETVFMETACMDIGMRNKKEKHSMK